MLASVRIEIQVMSPFMYGFATIEHDILYKQLSGPAPADVVGSLTTLRAAAALGEHASREVQRGMLAKANPSPTAIGQSASAGEDPERRYQREVVEWALREDVRDIETVANTLLKAFGSTFSRDVLVGNLRQTLGNTNRVGIYYPYKVTPSDARTVELIRS